MDDYGDLGEPCRCECDDCRDGFHHKCRDRCARGHKGRDSFHQVVAHLIGETVRVQTNGTAFYGKLACVETTFISVAGHGHRNEAAGVDGDGTHVTFIPFRKINAVTAL